MKLDVYLKEIGESPCGWAKKHGFPLPVITRFLNGERGLSLKTALKINKITDGAVKPEDLDFNPPSSSDPPAHPHPEPAPETSP